MKDKRYDTGLTRVDADCILAYAKHDMSAKKAAAELYMADMSVNYHFQVILKKTGLKPQRFYDLVKLIPIAMKTVRIADEEGDA